jgi:hypothetical protein
MFGNGEVVQENLLVSAFSGVTIEEEQNGNNFLFAF